MATKSQRVYAVFLYKGRVCNPTTDEIMVLDMTREKGVGEREGRCFFDKSDYHFQMSQNSTKYAFSMTGMHLTQGPGRIWLFRSLEKARTFQNGFFAYKIFLGACLSGDDTLV